MSPWRRDIEFPLLSVTYSKHYTQNISYLTNTGNAGNLLDSISLNKQNPSIFYIIKIGSDPNIYNFIGSGVI